MYYYLHDNLGLDAHVTGVDLKSGLLKQLQAKSEAMGWDQLKFQVGAIAEYDKSMTVLKLRAARERKRIQDGKCEGKYHMSAPAPEWRLIAVCRILHGSG